MCKNAGKDRVHGYGGMLRRGRDEGGMKMKAYRHLSLSYPYPIRSRDQTLGLGWVEVCTTLSPRAI